MLTLKIALATKIALGAVPAAAINNFVTNGQFEATPLASSSQVGNGFAQAATGWTSNGFNLLYIGGTQTTTSAANQYSDRLTYFRSGVTTDTLGTGGNFTALDGDTDVHGAFQQTITGLTTDQTYLVTFDWGATQLRNRTGAATEQLAVTFGGNTQNTAVLNNVSEGFSGWQAASFSFVATGPSQALSFLSNGTPNGLQPIALLDNVSLTAAPEPATWSLLVIGFGMMGWAARHRSAAVPA